SAGHGGVGSYAGGAGSVGGAAGQASGGGVFVRKPATLAPGARFVLSTLSNNRVYSGFGGQGGCGGPAYVFAGPGLNGGRNGLARGGGLFVEEGAAQVQLTDSTVAGNTVDAGGGGFAGTGAALIGGPVHPLDHPVRYQAATSVQLVDVGGLLVPAPPIAHGAASVLRDRTGFALGGPPSPNAYAAPLEHDGNGFVLFNEDRVSDVVATAAAATGAPIAATGALVGTAVFAGY